MINEQVAVCTPHTDVWGYELDEIKRAEQRLTVDQIRMVYRAQTSI